MAIAQCLVEVSWICPRCPEVMRANLLKKRGLSILLLAPRSPVLTGILRHVQAVLSPIGTRLGFTDSSMQLACDC